MIRVEIMASQKEIVNKYVDAHSKLYMTLEEADVLSRELASRFRGQLLANLDQNNLIVAGIANGGLMVAAIVANELGVSMEIIYARRKNSRLKRALSRLKPLVNLTAKVLRLPVVGPSLVQLIDKLNKLETSESGTAQNLSAIKDSIFKDRDVVLIDDCIESGQSVRFAKKFLIDNGAKSVATGVITLKDLEDDPVKADQFAPIVYINKRIQHYPWSQNNAAYDDFLVWLKAHEISPWI